MHKPDPYLPTQMLARCLDVRCARQGCRCQRPTPSRRMAWGLLFTLSVNAVLVRDEHTALLAVEGAASLRLQPPISC